MYPFAYFLNARTSRRLRYDFFCVRRTAVRIVRAIRRQRFGTLRNLAVGRFISCFHSLTGSNRTRGLLPENKLPALPAPNDACH
jgi:hypothetical protein